MIIWTGKTNTATELVTALRNFRHNFLSLGLWFHTHKVLSVREATGGMSHIRFDASKWLELENKRKRTSYATIRDAELISFNMRTFIQAYLAGKRSVTSKQNSTQIRLDPTQW